MKKDHSAAIGGEQLRVGGERPGTTLVPGDDEEELDRMGGKGKGLKPYISFGKKRKNPMYLNRFGSFEPNIFSNPDQLSRAPHLNFWHIYDITRIHHLVSLKIKREIIIIKRKKIIMFRLISFVPLVL